MHVFCLSCDVLFIGGSSSQHVTTLKFGGHRHSDSYKEKCFIKSTNLINMYCHWKIELIGLLLGKKKMSQYLRCTFWEEVPKINKHIFPLMTTFYKIETCWAKKVVKSILETLILPICCQCCQLCIALLLRSKSITLQT